MQNKLLTKRLTVPYFLIIEAYHLRNTSFSFPATKSSSPFIKRPFASNEVSATKRCGVLNNTMPKQSIFGGGTGKKKTIYKDYLFMRKM